MKIVIVICSYNERENVGRMIEAISKIRAKTPHHSLHLLYVDGNSPDGTAAVIKSKQTRFPWLHLLVETKKEGLGAAYAKGMVYAITTLKADYLVEMDTDFQHRPEDLPALIDKISAGYDYIIGSRYIKGGSIPREWGIDRKFLSIVGNLVARIALLLPKIHDVTGGFRISKVNGFMAKFDFTTLLSQSFAYKIHLLHYMLSSGAKYIEVPISFEHRSHGESKIIKNELIETLRVIFLVQLNSPKISRFFKFGFVGAFGLLIQTLVFEILGLRLRVLTPSIATVVGGELAIISNFILNNLWTFKDYAVTGTKFLFKFFQFNLTSLISLTVQFVILFIGESIARGNNPVIRGFYFGAIIIVLTINYTVYNVFIWKTTKLK